MILHRILITALSLAIIAFLTACGSQSIGTRAPQGIVEGNTDFAFELYRELAELKDAENMFFSPHSISVALAMTYAGARGDTADAMEETLNFDMPQETLHTSFQALDDEITSREGLQLYTANSLWGQQDYGFLPEFLDLVETSYGAGMNLVDFISDTENARIAINDWVYEKTREKIKDMIPPGNLNALVRLVLVNAIYFKADWLMRFDPERTSNGRFQLLDGEWVEAQMMTQNSEFPFIQTEDYSAIELPYSGEELSMIVILPEIDKFNELENQLDRTMLDDIVGSMSEAKLDVYFPKFEMESGFTLVDVLSRMGMTVAFQLGRADFSGMDGTRELFISDVLHKAYVLVNEEGTEAAAATAIVISGGGVMGPSFNANHPFIFLIRDRETGAILFMGRMMDPSTAQVSESTESG